MTQKWTAAADAIAEDARHVADGGAIMLVPVTNDDELERATAVLRARKPTRLRYFTATTFEDV